MVTSSEIEVTCNIKIQPAEEGLDYAANNVPIDKCSLELTIILAAIFLGEAMTWKTVVGSLLIVAGTMIMII